MIRLVDDGSGNLAARGESPAALPSHRAESARWGPGMADDAFRLAALLLVQILPGILTRRALRSGRHAALGSTRHLHHGLLALTSAGSGQPTCGRGACPIRSRVIPDTPRLQQRNSVCEQAAEKRSLKVKS